jgi:hypothetical protein
VQPRDDADVLERHDDLQLAIVDVLVEVLAPRHDDRPVARPHGVDDARHAGVGDHEVGGAQQRGHLLRRQPAMPLDPWPRRDGLGVAVLYDQLRVAGERERDADEAVERLVVGPDGREDQ